MESPLSFDHVDTSSIAFPEGLKLREAERLFVLETLKRHKGNRTHTAYALGIGIRTLLRKLQKYANNQ